MAIKKQTKLTPEQKKKLTALRKEFGNKADVGDLTKEQILKLLKEGKKLNDKRGIPRSGSGRQYGYS